MGDPRKAHLLDVLDLHVLADLARRRVADVEQLPPGVEAGAGCDRGLFTPRTRPLPGWPAQARHAPAAAAAAPPLPPPHLSGNTPQRSWPTTLRPLIASDLALSPSVRMSVHSRLLRVPASLASDSLVMPLGERAGRRRRRSSREPQRWARVLQTLADRARCCSWAAPRMHTCAHAPPRTGQAAALGAVALLEVLLALERRIAEDVLHQARPGG